MSENDGAPTLPTYSKVASFAFITTLMAVYATILIMSIDSMIEKDKDEWEFLSAGAYLMLLVVLWVVNVMVFMKKYAVRREKS